MNSSIVENKKLRVMIADDHLIVREGLRFLLEGHAEFELVGDAFNGASAVRLVEERQPHVVLMDLRMPDMDGLAAIQHIRSCWPQVAVVILTTYHDEDLILRGLRSGAAGYLLKDIDRETLFHAIRTAARGETLLRSEILMRLLSRLADSDPGRVHYSQPARRAEKIEPVLTARELDVVAGVACGERNKEIAARLGIGEPTVKTHLSSLYSKLGVDSRASAVAVAIGRGLLTLPQKDGFSRTSLEKQGSGSFSTTQFWRRDDLHKSPEGGYTEL